VKALVTTFVSGALFALGLAISGMTNPNNVLAFLNVAGSWDPSLMFVMVGAIGVYAPVYWLRERRAGAQGTTTVLGTPQRIDRRLVAGAALFGMGWGLAGYCPGPALTSMGAGAGEAIFFCVAMIAGFWLVRRGYGGFNRRAA
jgi:uncharacterized membrane protein YedE/YeeE